MLDIVRIQEAIRKEQLDGWLFYDHHLRDPLAYRVLGLPTDRQVSRRWYYLIPANGEPRALVHRIESGALHGLRGETHVYSSWPSQRAELRWLLQGCRSVAMQYSPECAIPYVSLVDAGTVEMIAAHGVRVASSANLIQIFEARWTNAQLEMHLEAGRRVDQIRAEAFEIIRERLRAGAAATEWDVCLFIRQRFAERGLVTDHGPIVAVNEHASDPHYEPASEGSAVIRQGDAVLIDLWAKLDQPGSVYYDITWNGFCGSNPPERLQQIFSVAASARKAATDKVRAGVRQGSLLRGFEIDDVARTYVSEAGFGEYFVHRTGHSIGTDVHGTGANMDNWETHDERTLIAGTCFSVEPGIYLPDFGVRSEVNVYVGEHDAIVTGQEQDALLLLV